ncbi:MarR family winged helix-turn-helix transcriptional regulator [Streptosporangium sp. NPDC023615]|uniref:MarR family winged helix-turn-helix transcriptional regulator n=1 Tax=Streptosporangium sp. NPDC023615 TaxID=3154794 RepID=UPI00342DB1BF
MSPDTPREDTPEPDPPWLSPDQQREWRALVALFMTLPPALDAQLKRDAGMNSFEYQVLAALSEAPGRTVRLSDLAALSQGSLSRLSHAITRLERSGWVERHSEACRGGRRTQARLTDAGFARVEEIAPGHVREARRLVVDVLTPEQLAALGDAARAITAVAMADAPEACREARGC